MLLLFHRVRIRSIKGKNHLVEHIYAREESVPFQFCAGPEWTGTSEESRTHCTDPVASVCMPHLQTPDMREVNIQYLYGNLIPRANMLLVINLW